MGNIEPTEHTVYRLYRPLTGARPLPTDKRRSPSQLPDDFTDRRNRLGRMSGIRRMKTLTRAISIFP